VLGAVVGQRQIDLVDDQGDAMRHAPVVDARELVRRHDGAGGIGRAGDQEGAGSGRGVAFDGLKRELEAAAGVDRHTHHASVAKADEVAVTGITRVGHQYVVVRTGQQPQRQQQCAGRAGRDDDAPRLDRGLPARGIPSGDGRAQPGQAERTGVVRMAGAQRGNAGFDDGAGRGEVGFADFEMDDVASGCFQGLGAPGDP